MGMFYNDTILFGNRCNFQLIIWKTLKIEKSFTLLQLNF